ncbi:substrate-binding periplasmic protein [Sneathiella limimaris]|uniref:substrate-binding periplasmic protein n=1 Tax=Sneathiella limimaris TaxID=1964213 RepID=UPI00146CEB8F|nr:transporter substrate-binding domain-containing protein [Sneathiella limimaris]
MPGGDVTREVVEAAFAAINQEIEIQILPWRRGYEETLKADPIVATFPYVATPDRKEAFYYSDPIMWSPPAVLLVRKDIDFKVETTEDLAGRLICYPFGYALPEGIAKLEARGELNLVRPKTAIGCLEIVLEGRSDATVTTEHVVGWLSQQLNLDISGLRFLKEIINPGDQYYLIVSKSYPKAKDLLARFNTGLAKIKANGKYDNILSQIRADM